MLVLLIAIGGAIGAVTRHAVGSLLQDASGHGFPWGTITVNVAGSFALAAIARSIEILAAPPAWRGLLAIGFCGSFTTFSAFGYESVRLFQAGQYNRAAFYIGASVLLSISAILIGLHAADAVLGSTARLPR
jgi:CrcB protein